MPSLRHCQNCAAAFKIKPSRVLTGRGQYCSTACKNAKAYPGWKKNYFAEYQAYMRAKGRCTNPSYSNYADYGGRGIEFKFESFGEFIQHLGPRPDGLSLDRIDNDGDYEAGNVRWATFEQQCASRRPPSWQVDKLLKRLRS